MQRMHSDDCWGGYSQIGAIAAMLCVDIHVFQDEYADDAPMTQEAILRKQGLLSRGTLYIARVDRRHYVSTAPLPVLDAVASDSESEAMDVDTDALPGSTDVSST